MKHCITRLLYERGASASACLIVKPCVHLDVRCRPRRHTHRRAWHPIHGGWTGSAHDHASGRLDSDPGCVGPLMFYVSTPSSLKRDCARRATVFSGECLADVHAKSHLTPET